MSARGASRAQLSAARMISLTRVSAWASGEGRRGDSAMLDRKNGSVVKGKRLPRAPAHPDRVGPPVPLFGPGIAPHVVAVLLPEAGVVLLQQLEPAHPLGALPEVEVWHQEADRTAVLRSQGLAVVAERQEILGTVEVLKRQVGGEAVLRVHQ